MMSLSDFTDAVSVCGNWVLNQGAQFVIPFVAIIAGCSMWYNVDVRLGRMS